MNSKTQTPLFAPTHSKHHWPEDFEHENGNYFCKCNTCGADFVGHKRRVQCKSCFLTAVVAERDQLKAAMKLAHDQYMGAGGNLRPQEIVDCMKIIIKEALEKYDG